MKKIIKCTVSKKFPIPNPIPDTDNARAELNSEFIDIIHNVLLPTQKEVKTWSHESFRYGLFVKSDIPFFIIDFGGWDLDVSVNILKVTCQKQRDLWLKKNSGCLRMFLVNARNNDLESIRNVGFSSIANFKQVLQKQVARYQSDSDVECEIDRICSKYSTKEMIRRTNMIKLR